MTNTIDYAAAYDPAYRDHLLTNDEVLVEHDAYPNADGTAIEIRRTVWRKSKRRQSQVILWQETIAVLPRNVVPDFVRDIVSSLAVQ